MLFNTVAEDKTSLWTGQAIRSPHRRWGSSPVGRCDSLSARSRREADVEIWEQKINRVPRFMWLRLRAVLSMSILIQKPRTQDAIQPTEGLEETTRDGGKRKSGAKLRNLPLFRGLDVTGHVVDHFLWYYITKFSCNHEKRMVFLSPTTPPKNRALFNIWLTNISLVPASQLLTLDNILVAYTFYGKSANVLVTFVSNRRKLERWARYSEKSLSLGIRWTGLQLRLCHSGEWFQLLPKFPHLQKWGELSAS